MRRLRQPRVQNQSGNMGQSVPALLRQTLQDKLKMFYNKTEKAVYRNSHREFNKTQDVEIKAWREATPFLLSWFSCLC